LGGADLALTRLWVGRTSLASGGVWTAVLLAPKMGSTELHLVHLMHLPTWIASAW